MPVKLTRISSSFTLLYLIQVKKTVLPQSLTENHANLHGFSLPVYWYLDKTLSTIVLIAYAIVTKILTKVTVTSPSSSKRQCPRLKAEA
jgi:hypothetical protein